MSLLQNGARGVALEGMRRWEEAIADYKAVLAAAPTDPSAWNNLGNPNAALGNWEVRPRPLLLHGTSVLVAC